MLKLNVKVGQRIAIGGPTTLLIESKSGQSVGLAFDADQSVPIRIIPAPDGDGNGFPESRGEPLGLDGKGKPPGSALSNK